MDYDGHLHTQNKKLLILGSETFLDKNTKIDGKQHPPESKPNLLWLK